MPILFNSQEDGLMEGFRQGQEKSYSQIFKTIYPALCYYALRITGDQAASEDIAEEAFIQVWNRREQFFHFNVLKSYLYTSTRNACLNWIKKTQRQLSSEKEMAVSTSAYQKYVLEDIIRAEVFREVYTALDNLPPQCRKIMKMLFVDGKNTGEIAKELQLTKQTIKSQKARGVMLLRRRLLVLVQLCFSLKIFYL